MLDTRPDDEWVERQRRRKVITADAIHAVDRLPIAGLGLDKAEGLASVASPMMRREHVTAPEALEKILQSHFGLVPFSFAVSCRFSGIMMLT